MLTPAELETLLKPHKTSVSAENAIVQLIGNGVAASEATLQLILAAIQQGADYESHFVTDADGIKYLEVRIYNPDTQTWDAPIYFLPGSATPILPGPGLNYDSIDTFAIAGPFTVSSSAVFNWDASVGFTTDTIYFPMTEPWSISVDNYAIIGGAPTITLLCSNDDSTYNTYKTSATLVDISNTANRVMFDDMFIFKYMQVQYVPNGATGTFTLQINK